MRAKFSDQDLTDYALNELEPADRLYIESLLAVSEECRNDVYETIDLAMMLEEGFEREDAKVLSLKPDQREALLDVRVKSHFFHRSVAVLAAAAAVAVAFVTKDQWLPKGSAGEMVRVSNHMGNMMVQAVTAAEGEDFVNQLDAIRKLTEDKWLPTQAPAGATVFGPPSPFSMEGPHAALDLKP